MRMIDQGAVRIDGEKVSDKNLQIAAKTCHTYQVGKRRFARVSLSCKADSYALLTRPPLATKEQAPRDAVRLACVKHTASVQSEPGSNSSIVFLQAIQLFTKSLYSGWLSIQQCLT